MVVANRRQEVGDVVIVQPIMEVTAFAVGDYEVQLPEGPQLLGDGSRLHLDGGGELVDGAASLEKGVEKAHPAAGAEDLHALRDRGGLARTQPLRWVGMGVGMRHRA